MGKGFVGLMELAVGSSGLSTVIIQKKIMIKKTLTKTT